MPSVHQSDHEISRDTLVAPLIGRDEMNLAEFPIALITDRVPEGQTTLYFESKQGRLTIKGSQADGLPTASDADVIVALIHLTKTRNNFSDATVNFSRYELLKLLNWSNEGKNYLRLNLSFDRWHGVALHFDKSWWDNKLRRYVSAKIHIIESIIIADRADQDPSGGNGQLPLSSFTWNKKFLESCQADNLKSLNLDLYFSLRHPSSKRLYRFLDKRFYHGDDFTFDLSEIAHDRVGLSRNYSDAGKIKEKLQPAIDELTEIGFLAPLKREERYSKAGPGRWNVRFIKRSASLSRHNKQNPDADTIGAARRGDVQELDTAGAEQSVIVPFPEQTKFHDDNDSESVSLTAEIIKRGVTKSKAVRLVKSYPLETIKLKMEVLDWLLSEKDKRVAKSPAGYLVKSIEDDYAAPKGFKSQADLAREKEAKLEAERKAEESRKLRANQKAFEAEIESRIESFWHDKTPEQQAHYVRMALAHAGEAERQAYHSMPDETKIHQKLKAAALKTFRDAYIRKLLTEIH